MQCSPFKTKGIINTAHLNYFLLSCVNYNLVLCILFVDVSVCVCVCGFKKSIIGCEHQLVVIKSAGGNVFFK